MSKDAPADKKKRDRGFHFWASAKEVYESEWLRAWLEEERRKKAETADLPAGLIESL